MGQRIMLDVRVPMRDGTLLSADVYLPPEGDCFPVLLTRTIYSKESYPETDGARPNGYVGWGERFMDGGYAVVIQDCRGRYDSDGVWEVYVQDEDGHDTVEWLIRQPWCDGNVGMFGISYLGFTQMHPAPLASEGLKAILPIGATPDGYDMFWQQGAFLMQQASHFLQIGRRTSHAQGMAMLAGLPGGTMGVGGGKAGEPPGDLSYLYERMPLYSAFDEYDDVKIWKEILDHNTYDDYWQKRIVNGRYGTIEAPAYFLTGWWDCTVRHMFEAYENWTRDARPEARARTKIMCGPWTHTRIGVADWGQDVRFGPDAELDIFALHRHWYDQRLKGIATGWTTRRRCRSSCAATTCGGVSTSGRWRAPNTGTCSCTAGGRPTPGTGMEAWVGNHHPATSRPTRTCTTPPTRFPRRAARWPTWTRADPVTGRRSRTGPTCWCTPAICSRPTSSAPAG